MSGAGHTAPKPGTKPHTARLYDYFLGGKTHYAVDREAAVPALNANPHSMVAARQNREFMHRAALYAVKELGIRQFLDIGTGIPTAPNLHQVVQDVAPESRIVYSDNDPIVLAHARALMSSTPEGATDYVEADVRDPRTILEHARKTLDFEAPIALSVVALLHFLPDEDDPYGLVRRLVAPLVPGSALILSHGALDLDDGRMAALAEHYRQAVTPTQFRTREETARFFEGLDLVAPDIAPTCEWRMDLELGPVRQLPGTVSAAEAGVWAGVAVKH
ncbi:SAM-dependent methyltransferase [Streptomyces tubbatahanensis]|uniref:SAM-dependent methyltransferase n=1 Tax=Streptomyces tubbatahanensis TaxID=2923272 RepID=A0ABY3Y1I4_9ACTN|nr:SAM-dependent methyltransferase [Streptomyces tubbatahanensis]UNT00454.1 SAM-dependent methyltransferase [Streptomyces tubbatahanensis]